jgi:hypothetical protein
VGIDDLRAQIEADEREDFLTLVENPKLTPIDYGKLRGIRPQKVYAALRSGKLTWDRCECGRRVVVVSEADELFNKGVKPNVDSVEGSRNPEDASTDTLPEGVQAVRWHTLESRPKELQ